MRNWTLGVIGLLAGTAASAQNDRVIASMPFEDVQRCGALAAKLRGDDSTLRQRDLQLEARGRALRVESDAIDAARRTVNARDTRQVNRFNARIAANRQGVDAYRAAITARNGVVTASKLASDQYNLLCANRPFDPELLKRLPPDHAAAIQSRSSDISIPVIQTAPRTSGGPVISPVVLLGASPNGQQGSPTTENAAAAGSGSSLEANRAAADSGNANAQFIMAQRYRRGTGVPRDDVQALLWLRKATDQRHPDATFGLSEAYREGRGVPTDAAKSQELLIAAADLGVASAQYNLALWFARQERSQDRIGAVAWMTKAAGQGDPEAQAALGSFYRRGIGTSRNYTEALRWYRLAAAQGFRNAQFHLGELIEAGSGTASDPVDALKWHLLAAGRTRVDASQGCRRRLLGESATRVAANNAADKLQRRLSVEQTDRAQRMADEWATASNAAAVAGC